MIMLFFKNKRLKIISALLALISVMSTLSYAASTSLLADFIRNPKAVVEASRAVRVSEGASENAWYVEHELIAHALGTVDGYAETNSCEAFIESYNKGYRVFEADFFLSSDNKLILRHDFDRNSYVKLGQPMDKDQPIMTLSKFLDTPIRRLYTPLDADRLVMLLNKYNDAYLVTDTKFTDAKSVELQFSLLCEAIDRAGNEELYDRIIVQIYNDDMYYTVKNLYEFKNYIYTLYQLPSRDFNRIGRFCEANGIKTVTMSAEIYSTASIEILHGYGCNVYFHTVNNLKEMQRMALGGADGFYTDNVTPEEY